MAYLPQVTATRGGRDPATLVEDIRGGQRSRHATSERAGVRGQLGTRRRSVYPDGALRVWKFCTFSLGVSYGRTFPQLDEARVWKIIADLSNVRPMSLIGFWLSITAQASRCLVQTDLALGVAVLSPFRVCISYTILASSTSIPRASYPFHRSTRCGYLSGYAARLTVLLSRLACSSGSQIFVACGFDHGTFAVPPSLPH